MVWLTFIRQKQINVNQLELTQIKRIVFLQVDYNNEINS